MRTMATVKQAEDVTVGGWKMTGRWLGTCKRCKNTFRQDKEPSTAQLRVDGCPVCTQDGTPAGRNQRVQYHQVGGSKSDKKCDARCQNAKGPSCECSCGGDRHGETR